ncbi:MAG: radical SAM protein [Thermodesulfobacteriota bacterium]
MLKYRNGEQSDPFFYIYSDPGWLRDYDPPRDFPFWINIEATNLCQLDCLFCSRQLATGPRSLMKEEVLDRIVAEVAEHPGAAIRVAGWGEPLLHPRFAEFVRRIKAGGVPLKVYTNGLLLTEEIMTAFIEAGLDELQFSMQGLTPAQYEFNRRRAKYDAFRAKVELAATRKYEAGADRPFLSLLTSVLKSELETANPYSFADDWLALVDKVAVDLTNLNFVRHLERVKELLDDQVLDQTHRPCVDVFLALEVNHNGLIEFCGQDAKETPEHILGRFPEMGLEPAWKSDKMEAQRQAVGREVRHDQLPVCRNCYHNTNKYDLFKNRY